MSVNFGGLLNLFGKVNSIFQVPEPIRVESRIRSPSIDSVKKFAWYAASVACPPESLKTWSCKSCKIATSEPVQNVVPFKNETTGASGYFGIDHSLKTILVAFRGSNNVQNFIHDLSDSQVPFEDAQDPSVLVHSGFLRSLNSLDSYYMPPLRQALSQSPTNKYTLTLTGVSLGAAEAALAAIRIHRQLGVPWQRITLYAFAMPRTGNLQFANMFNSNPMTAVRVVNYNDLVPHFPPATDYAHILHQLFVNRSLPIPTARYCDAALLEDPTCANAISPISYDLLSHFYVWDTQFHPILAC